MKVNNSICLYIYVLVIFSTVIQDVKAQNKTVNAFVEVFKEFPRLEKNLRKWDAPVVADLDQDGYQDLLINDHGLGIQVQWNNKGKFAKPYDIIMGDLHGVSIADIDNDGNLEVIMSRGGGSGSNARNSKMFRVVGREFIPLGDFKEPLALMRGRTVKFIDADNDGDLDLLNFAFPDSSKKGASESYVYENNGNGELVLHSTLPSVKANGQKTLITDFNDDAVLDIVLYGQGKTKAFKGNGDLTYTEVTNSVFPFDIVETTSISEIDFDNDGDLDLFITRGTDFKKGQNFYNPKTKDWGFFTTRGQFQFEDIEVGDVLNMENFQSQWPNNDTYFIGETGYDYEFEGETHSGKNIRLVNSDALGFPDNPDYKGKRGWYIGYVGNRKWRIAGFLWAPSTGVVHGVKNYAPFKHPEGFNDILLENTNGKFKEVTKKLGLVNKEHTMANAVADFNNDGLDDILVIRRGKLVFDNESILYLNRGKSGFEEMKNHGVVSKELGAIGMAVEVMDYNEDGNIDVVIGNERGKWHLFKNQLKEATENKFINIEVGKSPKANMSPLGAKVELSSCSTRQTYRIGTTNSQYSQGHNNLVHFGISQCSSPNKLTITWSNGEVLKKTIKTVNTKISVGRK
ncbi:CRTAC1 family protein [Seonamhaeicola marinus]|uniref:CRTAC1 family protein n=1 Tax=Seonamhaeicola marinus TaxID=1912246 RepID=A0A5D0J8Q3_9FLAO|nr:CRTAC1 family protein [Seonamhaeicola marinus]TYA92124.1 CRTAC1 family protein [Seonamhaeicola marinus]